MTEIVKINSKKQFGSKANIQKVEVGKWFAFSDGDMVIYGKVQSIENDGYANIEKSFKLPSYRPYASHKWFDSLPFAVIG